MLVDVDIDGLIVGIGMSATGCYFNEHIEREERNRIIIIIVMCYSSQFKDNAF